jgi:hypothetical protein
VEILLLIDLIVILIDLSFDLIFILIDLSFDLIVILLELIDVFDLGLDLDLLLSGLDIDLNLLLSSLDIDLNLLLSSLDIDVDLGGSVDVLPGSLDTLLDALVILTSVLTSTVVLDHAVEDVVGENGFLIELLIDLGEGSATSLHGSVPELLLDVDELDRRSGSGMSGALGLETLGWVSPITSANASPVLHDDEIDVLLLTTSVLSVGVVGFLVGVLELLARCIDGADSRLGALESVGRVSASSGSSRGGVLGELDSSGIDGRSGRFRLSIDDHSSAIDVEMSVSGHGRQVDKSRHDVVDV